MRALGFVKIMRIEGIQSVTWAADFSYTADTLRTVRFVKIMRIEGIHTGSNYSKEYEENRKEN